jgi:hypothetical protein
MENDQDLKKIQDFLELQSTEVRNDCKIVSAKELGQDFLLRIDKKPPEKFIPNMPQSTVEGENNTLPRITSAPTLVGCLIGYFRVETDVHDGSIPDAHGELKFAGGYAISKLSFEHCLRPGTTLVADVNNSDEHWIVPYCSERVEYVSVVIGQLFVGAVTYLPVSGHRPGVRIELYLSITSEDTICITPERKLRKGFYRFTLFWSNLKTRSVDEPHCLTSLEIISMDDYCAAKKIKANLLSYSDNLPGFSNW